MNNNKKLSRLLEENYSLFLRALPNKFKGKITNCNHPFFAHNSKSITKNTKLKQYPKVNEVHIYTDYCRLCGKKFHTDYSYRDKRGFHIISKVKNHLTGLMRWKN